MNRAVRTMPDAALLEKAKILPWEDRLSRIGCGLSLIVAAVVTVRFAWFIWTHLRYPTGDTWTGLFIGLLLGLFEGLLFGGIVCAGFQIVVGLRPFPYRAELKRRYRPKMLRQAVHEAEQGFTASHPPDWALIVSALEPRYQIRDLILVDLWEGPPPEGRIAVRHQVPMDFVRKDPVGVETGQAALPVVDCERLLIALRGVNLSVLRVVGLSAVRDVSPYEYGCRCRMAVLQREPRLGVVISYNLESGDAARPTAILAKTLLGLSRSVVIHPLVNGIPNVSDANAKDED